MTQKVVGVIEMTYLYDARYSFVLLRPKNDSKFLTQSAAKWICGLYQIGGSKFTPLSCSPVHRSFFSNANGSVFLGKLTPIHNGQGGGGKTKLKLDPRGPIFADFWSIFLFWALFLKIQSAITPSLSVVRGSSSDSRNISPIPFNNMLNQA